jgi:NADH-quinone oxidoreductase subunit J
MSPRRACGVPAIPQIISPIALFGLCVLGGAGVCLALPRRGLSPQVVGGLIAGLAGGLLMLALGLNASRDQLPNIYFYVFSVLGLGAALRVITHPKPVYAALYFILSVIATAGLFLLLSAEFMAFALIIVYAGAILITYLFVIMLATQAPEEGQEDVAAEYDVAAREPIAATAVAFVLLAALSVMVVRGIERMPSVAPADPNALLADMPRKVDRVLKDAGVLAAGETAAYDAARGAIVVSGGEASRVLTQDQWPRGLTVTNSELVGFNLLRDHPGTIEIAGVILLMAMLGAVVLSRKQVQLDEDAKLARVTQLAAADPSFERVSESPLELVQQPTHGSHPAQGGVS